VDAFIPVLERVVGALGPSEPSVRQSLAVLRAALVPTYDESAPAE
jgi:hypothetical protein